MQSVPPTPTAGNSLTVLTSQTDPQVKVYNADGSKSEIRGKWYLPTVAPFSTLYDLQSIFTQLSFNQLIIPGQRNDAPSPNTAGTVTCTRHDKPHKGQVAYFEDRLAPTLTFDLDNTPIPDGHSWHDPVAMAGAVWADLQARYGFLRDVGAVWKCSGSAGLFDNAGLAKFHFTVILQNPLQHHDRDNLLKAVKEADASMGQIARKHFFAGRICQGFADPLANVPTSGVIEGRALHWLATPKPERKIPAGPINISDQTSARGAELLQEACDELAGIPEADHERHNRVRAIAKTVGGYIGGGLIARVDAESALKAAVQVYRDPRHHEGTIDEMLADGIHMPLTSDVRGPSLADMFGSGPTYMPGGMTTTPPQGMPAPRMPSLQGMPAPAPVNGMPAPTATFNGMPAPTTPVEIAKDLVMQTSADNVDQLGGMLAMMPKPQRQEVLEHAAAFNPATGDAAAAHVAQAHADFRTEQATRLWDDKTSAVLDNFWIVANDRSGSTAVYNDRTGSSHNFTGFHQAYSFLDPVLLPAPSKTNPAAVKEVPATKYWWDHTEQRVDEYGFKPGAPMVYVDEATGAERLNQYKPHKTAPAPRGLDVSPWLFLLGANITDAGDRHIFVSALAHMVTRPGDLLRWAPVLQGGEGCGKGSLLGETVRHCVGSNMGLATPLDLADKFGGYAHNKTAIIVDEIGERSKAALSEIAEMLKPRIADRLNSYRLMRTDAFTDNNYASWGFTTNFIGSMLASKGTRRYSHFISALQTPEDIAAALPVSAWDSYPDVHTACRNPAPDWFDLFYTWWGMGGNEAVRGYLEGYEAGEWGRAPITTSTATATTEGEPEMVRVIRECIASNMQGFRGGFISSSAIRDAMRADDIKPPPGRWFGKCMDQLGYFHVTRVRPSPAEEMRFPGSGHQIRIYYRNHQMANWLPNNIAAEYDRAQIDQAPNNC